MFKFRLEFLLRYRRQKEEMAMYELAQQIREANDIEIEIEEIRDRANQLADSIRNMIETPVAVPLFTMYSGYREHLGLREQTAKQRLNKAEAKIENKRQKLVQASVDHQVMERFKEKQEQEHKQEEQRREQMFVDELANISRQRRDRGHSV